MSPEQSRNRKALRAVLGCCLSIFWSGSIAFGFPGVMSPYWQEQFGVSAAQTGAVVTFMLLALAVGMFFSGKIHTAIGMRRCTLIGLVFYLLSFLILRQAENITMVYLWGFVANLGCCFIYGPGLATAQQWMPHRRGLVSGVVNMVFGIAAAVLSPIWNRMLDTLGAESLILSLMLCLTVTYIAAAFLTEVPARARLTEDELAIHRSLNIGKNGVEKSLTVAQAVRTPAFRLIWLCWLFMGAAGISMVSLSKSYAVSVGLGAAALLTAFNLSNGIGRIFVGMLMEKIRGEYIAATSFILAAAGYCILPHTANPALCALCALFVGFGFGTLFTVTGPLASERFGLPHFGAIFGLIFTAYGFISGVVGPALAGFILDITGGSYTIVFSYLAVFALIGTTLILKLRKY